MLPLTPFVLTLGSVLALISITPDPIAIHLGPVPVFWYGVCYALGLAAAYVVITREARRRGLDARLVDNGIIIVGIAALLGGRLYHVIDQWHLYQDNPIKIILPPYTGLGVYGGIITGTIAAWYLTRRWHQSFAKWADVIAPGLFVMQAIGRWGNFFNQELYGPPTDLPWGITIDCAHRIGDHGIAQWPCDQYPFATTGFHPLFLYESLSGALGAITLLWIARRWGSRMRPGDLFLVFMIWYATVRFVLETFRMGNWTFFGVPTAMLVSVIAVVGSLLVLAFRHRPGAASGDRWGEPPVVEPEAGDDGEEWVEVDEDEVPAAEDELPAADGGPVAVEATAGDKGPAVNAAQGPASAEADGSGAGRQAGVPGDEDGDRDPA
jgi:phosphatidylglycerol:prolipoprotein diacylglycerol transferase